MSGLSGLGGLAEVLGGAGQSGLLGQSAMNQMLSAQALDRRMTSAQGIQWSDRIIGNPFYTVQARSLLLSEKTKPTTYREELQAETNERLKDVLV